ncbi:hemerythrin domain-containing protein [Micromonospora sp. WMMD714]|uniref:hemerythrin domain-containing protein n=1 Tax=Micromonospora sp. WMMD714 TaxID=3016097 RepID=UPI00249BB880|nr:hemerythrin domain-containing protein [Micromonospora sp. WMMD714]WFE67153.1 hemerythrin domain-containing protein [Micromonospora sp. WMMD714]
MHPDSTPTDRLTALGHQLVEIHLWLLDELDQIRAALDTDPSTDADRPPGTGRPADDGPPAGPGRRTAGPGDDRSPPGGRLRHLRTHCLSFCAALTRHHTGEDAGAFRVLADEAPELRPVLDKLSRDHRMVDWIVRRIEALVADPPVDDPAALDRVRVELDGLSAILGSHFRYEERTLTAALDALGDRAGGTEELLGVSPPPDW